MPKSPPEAQRSLFRRAVKVTVEIITEKEDIGTGVVLTKNGIIVTAYHVVKGCRKIDVRRCRLSEKTWNVIRYGHYTADVIYKNPKADIAVLKLRNPPKTLSVASLGFSDELTVGTPVFRVGRDEDALSSGHIIGSDKIDGIPEFKISIEGDSGASGGPVFNERCKVVGIALRVNGARTTPPVTYMLPINWIRERTVNRQNVKELLPRKTKF